MISTFKKFYLKNRIFKRDAFIRIQWPARLWIFGIVPSPTSFGKRMASDISTPGREILARKRLAELLKRGKPGSFCRLPGFNAER